MDDREARATRHERRAELLSLAFGSTVAMWTVAYLARLLPVAVPNGLLLVPLLVCQGAGGYFAGRLTARGAGGGATVGALSALLNLLVLGSVLGGETGGLRPAAWLWVPASLGLGAILGALGASMGAARRRTFGRSGEAGPAWNSVLAGVAALATLLLLGAGGLVTSREAGLAVVDWPNSFGRNLFLYPLAEMTGGVFYEHAHRLLGSLVGLVTLALVLQLQLSESRGRVKALAWLGLVAVIVQGVLGGLRVTGTFTLSQSPADMSPSTLLAALHGVLGQAFFALLAVLAAFTSRRWLSKLIPESRETAASERLLTALLIPFLLVQLVLGALLRHFGWGLLYHVSFAVIVVLITIAAGARSWGLYPLEPELKRTGKWLTILAGAQLLLGTGALIAVTSTPDAGDIPGWEVLLATVHQITGALLLAGAALLAVWVRRLLVDPPAVKA